MGMSRWKVSTALILISLTEILTFRKIPELWRNSFEKPVNLHSRFRRSVLEDDTTFPTVGGDDFEGDGRHFGGTVPLGAAGNGSIILYGLSPEYESEKKRVWYDSGGVPHVLEGMQVAFRLYGKFLKGTMLKLTKFNLCENAEDDKEPHQEVRVHPSGFMGYVETKMPMSSVERREVHICLRGSREEPWVKQEKPWLVFKLYKAILPTWLHVILLMILLGLSG